MTELMRINAYIVELFVKRPLWCGLITLVSQFRNLEYFILENQKVCTLDRRQRRLSALDLFLRCNTTYDFMNCFRTVIDISENFLSFLKTDTICLRVCLSRLPTKKANVTVLKQQQQQQQHNLTLLNNSSIDYVVDKYSSLKSYRLKNVVFSVRTKRAGHRHRPTITLKTQCSQTSTPSQPFKFALEVLKEKKEKITTNATSMHSFWETNIMSALIDAKESLFHTSR
uniref:Uncharacterized protein n=1 Tax=Glossina pallidipes TaxID=7398 RepID=A0A1B0AEK4_GLOPL